MITGLNANGLPSLSQDSSGNVTVKDGTQLLVAEGSLGAPSIAVKTNTDNGLDFQAVWVDQVISGASLQRYQSGLIRGLMPHRFEDEFILFPNATQNITGTGSVVLITAPHVKISSDGVYTLTTPLAAGTDGLAGRIENVSANAVTLQEGFLIAGNSLIDVSYSTDASAWLLVP